MNEEGNGARAPGDGGAGVEPAELPAQVRGLPALRGSPGAGRSGARAAAVRQLRARGLEVPMRLLLLQPLTPARPLRRPLSGHGEAPPTTHPSVKGPPSITQATALSVNSPERLSGGASPLGAPAGGPSSCRRQ